MRLPPQNTKLYLAGFFLLALAFLVFVQAAFNLDPIYSPSQPNQIVLLVTLSALTFLVLLIFGFVLLRTLVKVWAERKQQKPGSKFKTTVLVSLVTLTLIPAACLFLIAFGLLNRSIAKLCSASLSLKSLTPAAHGAERRHDHETIERILSHLDNEPQLTPTKSAAYSQLKSATVLDEGRHSTLLDSRRSRKTTWRNAFAAASAHTRPSSTSTRIDRRATRRGLHKGEILAIVFPPARPQSCLPARREAALRNAGPESESVPRHPLIILLLVTVLVLFAAVWIGLFLSKRITVPIDAVGGHSRNLGGNLDYRVDVHADDELGLLVTLFNDMANCFKAPLTT
jgi:nitrogen fixation/metabolism regulation signal transduction histidine kinase